MIEMKIYQLQLKCFHLQEMKQFYTEVLEMALLSESDTHFMVRAGSTKLYFEKGASVPYYHVCFRTGTEYFDHIFARLSDLLLPDEEGSYSLFWEGKQAYFCDPDGNILEILERPFYWGEQGGPAFSWFDVGEIGMPLKSISETKDSLGAMVHTRYAAESDQFAFYGDQDGVFVLVKEGRHWYPTERGATIHPIVAVVSGEQEGRYKHPELPYHVIVRKEWNEKIPSVQFRIARPTNQIDNLMEFYGEGLGLEEIGEFSGHDGYDGVMYGLPDNSYHLEFTQSEVPLELPQPTKEHLLVFYIPNLFELNRIVERLAGMGYHEVEPENPYWANGGVTIEDPDGWRIVLMHTVGI
jgi:catechol 2,3-dioxygenase-like lactoylglutathione lyase family enzyme